LFDILVPTLAELLNVYVESEEVLAAVVDVLFEQSVAEANFRYNGARICGVFCKSLDISGSLKSFPQLLLERFYQEHKQSKRTGCDKYVTDRLRGFAFFAGELFVNLEFQLTVAGGSQKYAVIGDSLLEILESLLTMPDDDNLKCVGQILKFAGTALEDYEIKNCGAAPLMDKIFQRIRDVTHNTDVNRPLREMLLRVVELRSNDWGRAASSTVQRSEHSNRQLTSGEAVLYGPDGVPLTVEEAHFLHSNGGACEHDDDEDYDFLRHIEGGWSTGDELDDEIAAAYEEFLRDQEDQ
jgi:polyadenylate-binding protein-interacting protein 1